MLMPVYQNFGPGVIAGNPIALDYLPTSWITAAVEAVGAITGALVEVTLDQIFDEFGPNYITPASATWYPVNTAPLTPMTAQAGDFYLTFPGPWRAIRLTLATNDVGVTFAVAQSTSPRS